MQMTAKTTTHVLPIADLDQRKIELVIEHLSENGYVPVIRHMLLNTFNELKLKKPDKERLAQALDPHESPMSGPGDLLGDIFFQKDSMFILDASRTHFEASVVGFDDNLKTLNEFCKEIASGIKLKFEEKIPEKSELNWKPFTRRISSRYEYRERLQSESSEIEKEPKFIEPKYDESDIKASIFLSDLKTRESFLKLAKLGKMMMKDASTEYTKDQLQKLMSLGLVAEEYLLTCKQDQHTICVVSSEKQLTAGPMSVLRCTTCNRPFSDENFNTIVTITEKGKNMVACSKWMSIWMTELLKNHGISKDTIKWNFAAGGDELDMLVSDFNMRVFFELKDREFGLGDAYPFSYRLNRYDGRLGVVVTTDKVSSDAKKFFSDESARRESPIKIVYLEGIESIPNGIKSIVQDMYKREIRRLVNPFRWKTGLNCWLIVESWLDSKREQIELLTRK